MGAGDNEEFKRLMAEYGTADEGSVVTIDEMVKAGIVAAELRMCRTTTVFPVAGNAMPTITVYAAPVTRYMNLSSHVDEDEAFAAYRAAWDALDKAARKSGPRLAVKDGVQGYVE